MKSTVRIWKYIIDVQNWKEKRETYLKENKTRLHIHYIFLQIFSSWQVKGVITRQIRVFISDIKSFLLRNAIFSFITCSMFFTFSKWVQSCPIGLPPNMREDTTFRYLLYQWTCVTIIKILILLPNSNWLYFSCKWRKYCSNTLPYTTDTTSKSIPCWFDNRFLFSMTSIY